MPFVLSNVLYLSMCTALYISVDEPYESDIELVMSQAKVSREVAGKALKDNNNDVVDAIMVFYLVVFFANYSSRHLQSKLYHNKCIKV